MFLNLNNKREFIRIGKREFITIRKREFITIGKIESPKLPLIQITIGRLKVDQEEERLAVKSQVEDRIS